MLDMFRFVAVAVCALVDTSVAGEIPAIQLNNGVQMPMLSLGTGGDMLNASATEANVKLALRAGFVAVDTARNYVGVQKGVGAALSGIPRASYFLTTKVGGFDALSIPAVEHSFVTKAMNEDLAELRLDYVDLMLLHYPPIRVLGNRCKALQEQWRALEDFYKAKKARAIGVSNYCQADLECLLETATVVPAVNQFMFHVGMGADPRGIKSYCIAKGIVPQAYSPLGAYDFTKIPPGKDISLIVGNLTNGIGKTYNKTGAQVALRWVIEHGVALNTESSSEKHLLQDLDIFSFNFSAQDKATLDAATSPAGEPNSQFGGLPLMGVCGPVSSAVVV